MNVVMTVFHDWSRIVAGVRADDDRLVAIVSAKAARVDLLETLLGFEEVSCFAMFAWLGIAGPGPVSLDHLVLRAFRRERPASDYGA